jgi:hypothetical protein
MELVAVFAIVVLFLYKPQIIFEKIVVTMSLCMTPVLKQKPKNCLTERCLLPTV